jgi:hypothetical protein
MHARGLDHFFGSKENAMKLRSTWVTFVLSLRLIFFIMALIVSDAQIVQAQRQKVPIFVVYSGDDSVGRNVVFQFKEAIRRSASYQLVSNQDETGMTISIVTLDVDSSTRTALSIVGTVAYKSCERGREHQSSAMFLHNLYVLGSERSVESGNTLLADLDKAWDDANQKWKQERKQEGCESRSGQN